MTSVRLFEAVGEAAVVERGPRPTFTPLQLAEAYLAQPDATRGSCLPNDHCFNWTNGGVTKSHVALFLRIGEQREAEGFTYVGRGFRPPVDLAVRHLPKGGTLRRVRGRLDRTPIDELVAGPDDTPPGFAEGHRRTRTVDARERSGAARAAYIELARRAHPAGRLACGVCGDVMSDLYGEAAEGLIHVHHLHPLADRTGAAWTDPATDLLCVCPNCHAVIHHGGACRTPHEVRASRRDERARRVAEADG